LTGRELPLAERAVELRRQFDRSFAAAPSGEAVESEDLLAIRVGADSYAVRLAEVSGLFAGRRIVSLPTERPDFLGLTGLRGALLPVFDLGRLLGGSQAGAPRWLMTAAAAPVALGFDGFDGHLRLPRGALVPQEIAAPARRHVREVVRTGDRVRPVVHLASVLEAIYRRAPAGAPDEER